MGVIYTVYPIDDRARKAAPDIGLINPPAEDGRHPTPSEIRAVVGDLDGFKASYTEHPIFHKPWQVMVEHAQDPDNGGWTLINVSEYLGEDQPTEIWFEKGWPDLIIRIMVGLSRTCGPLFILPDTGEAALVVRPGDNPVYLYESWEHTNPHCESDDDS
ncbi:hypothetical protein JXQ70_19920 [bacterium]|nr:hypothetical protein [bacterium]